MTGNFQDVSKDFSASIPIRCLTPPGKSESIRFYDTSSIDAGGRHLAVTRYSDDSHLPRPGEPALVIVRDLESGAEAYRESTAAWDSQLGAQAQWHPFREEVYFNVMDGSAFPHAVSINLDTGKRRHYPWTVYMLSPCGRYAVSPDLRKIGSTQAGYGVVVEDPHFPGGSGKAGDDGVTIIDLEKGTCRLAVSIGDLVDRAGIEPPGSGSFHVFHVKWSPVCDRIMVVLRWVSDEGNSPRRWVLACDMDGSTVHCLVSDSLWQQGGHHPNWYPDGRHIIMNLRPDPAGPLRFCKIADADRPQVAPLTRLTGSGHPTIHSSGKWLLTDAYLHEKMAPEGCSPLRLVDLRSGKERTLAEVPSKPAFPGPKQEWRVDLHPSWCSDWRHITFNGWHEGRRAVFLADLGSVLDASIDFADDG
ncbi:MAG: hypothetical protein ACP5I4_11750 [Oceanipulchritudo sp.]